MAVNVTKPTEKDHNSKLIIGAFTFVKEPTGRVVLHVDVDSGLYPLRLTQEQTLMLTEWLHAYPNDTQWS